MSCYVIFNVYYCSKRITALPFSEVKSALPSVMELVPSSLGTIRPFPVADTFISFRVPLPENEYTELG